MYVNLMELTTIYKRYPLGLHMEVGRTALLHVMYTHVDRVCYSSFVRSLPGTMLHKDVGAS